MPETVPTPSSDLSSKGEPAHRAQVVRKRADKRDAALAVGVDEAFIDRLVEQFYATIRDDPMLGPIFAERIGDWPEHLGRMKAFWRSILHNSGEFAGNPMVKHIAIPDIGLEHFSHWLELFYRTLRTLEGDPGATALVADRARMIADSLLTGIAIHRHGLTGGRAGEALPYV